MRKSALAALVGVSTACLCFAPAALAVTVVTGDRDTNAPLVVDPSSDPSGALETERISLPGIPPLAFIRKMPVTKIIERVTLGDLASDPSCTVPAKVQLVIRQHAPPQGSEDAGGDLYNFTHVLTSLASQDLPSTRGQVSWTVPATKLVKGRGYSFALYPTSGCGYARWTTWPHNLPTVDGGWKRCTGGPPAKTNTGGRIQYRMWHTAGASDRDPDCASDYSWAFDPSMPEGWLMTSSSPRAVVTGTYKTPPSNSQVCGAEPAAAGARAVWWRFTPSNAVYSDYVCMWSQYEDLDETTAEGWYHGMPWIRDGTGAPRDTYLELETIDYGALVRKYAPLLKFDLEGNFWNASPATLTDHWENVVIRQQTPTQWELFEHQGEGSLSWGLETLVAPEDEYPEGLGSPSENDSVDARGDHKQAADAFRFGPYDNTAFVHVLHDSAGKLWLQYWFFYYFNSQGPPEIGEHEGDWEMVQYRIGDSGVPEVATYAQHGDDDAESCPWPKVLTETVTDPLLGTRQAPLVFVAGGSQASYFTSGIHLRADPLPDDSALGNGETRSPYLDTIGERYPSWVRWPGEWGGEGSPESPGNQTVRWSQPQTFDSGAGPCVDSEGNLR